MTTNTKSLSVQAMLAMLLSEVKKIDFKSIVHLMRRNKNFDFESANVPETDNKKVRDREYQVIAIDYIMCLSKRNNWGLCQNNGNAYLYNGEYWVMVDTNLFSAFLSEAAAKMSVPQLSAKPYLFREQLLKQFMATAYIPAAQTDVDKVLINLKNGTFEINSDGSTKLREFDPADFMTYQLPFAYDPAAEAPRFQAYLDRCLPDESAQKVLAEYLGYLFIRNGSSAFKAEKVLILYGSGANGKSVFFEVVKALLGSENVTSYSLANLTDTQGYYRIKIADSLLNYASELNSANDNEMFKRLASGEPIEARAPYKEPVTLTQYAKLIFNCNELPNNAEQTHAFFRRFLIVKFGVTIPDEEQDRELHTKIIKSELAGVFNWILQGLRRLMERKEFTECQSSIETLERYKIDSDSIKLFLEEKGYSKSADKWVKMVDLYYSYLVYCKDDECCKPVRKRNFIKRLQNSGVRIETINIGNIAYLEQDPAKQEKFTYGAH